MKTGNSFVVEPTVYDDRFTKTVKNGHIAPTGLSSANDLTNVTL